MKKVEVNNSLLRDSEYIKNVKKKTIGEVLDSYKVKKKIKKMNHIPKTQEKYIQ